MIKTMKDYSVLMAFIIAFALVLLIVFNPVKTRAAMVLIPPTHARDITASAYDAPAVSHILIRPVATTTSKQDIQSIVNEIARLQALLAQITLSSVCINAKNLIINEVHCLTQK